MATSYFLPSMPAELDGITDLALDLRWSWNHAADELWRQIEPDLWDKTGNPWLILQTVSVERLQALAADAGFRKLLNASMAEYREAMQAPAWFQKAYAREPFSIAYFSMEYGLSEALPIYSGGLGILAGDYLKTASDLGVPSVGIGLLFQQGYFRQAIDTQGEQTESFPYNDPGQLPMMPVRDRNGEWLRVRIDFPGRALTLRCWEVVVGRTRLFLLDSNDPGNMPGDRGITAELYGGDIRLRLQQEIVLGIGGWRMLEAMNRHPEICHLNEGHAALAIIERARAFMISHHEPFNIALAATRPGNVFTTHTPVEAGFDRFPGEMVRHYLGAYAEQVGIGLDGLMALGRQDPNDQEEPLQMAFLATRGSGTVNAVSRLHSQVSRRIFQPLYPRWPEREVPMTYVTNGVHVPSWDSKSADRCWTAACGKGRWLSTLDDLTESFKKVPDEVLWELRMNQTRQFISNVRERLNRQLAAAGAIELASDCGRLLDPNVLTVGFARRFTAYKRPNLLLYDQERLKKIINHPERPVQLIIAGKAHPRDEEGKGLVQAWWRFAMQPEVRGRVVFLADYDMGVAEKMVMGVDLWVNTPRRPWEACGTSGMKILVNGGLNFSELEGWWAEAYQPEVGWAIGDGQEHAGDPDWDAHEAEELYRTFENDIIPCFYEHDGTGVPCRWVDRMRASISELTPRFSANRMLREYVDKLYAGAAARYRRRTAAGEAEAVQLTRWQESINQKWARLRFGNKHIEHQGDFYNFTVAVFLGDMETGSVQVQLYAEPLGDNEPEIVVMAQAGAEAGTVNGYLYKARVPALRPADHYTPRIVPFFKNAAVPLEAAQILWFGG